MPAAPGALAIASKGAGLRARVAPLKHVRLVARAYIVNAGASYWDQHTIIDAAAKAGGLPATTFLEYTPIRGGKQLAASLPSGARPRLRHTRARR